MAEMGTSKKYPKTLSAPVDEETWAWFVAQADAEDRTAGAHLRRLIFAHKAEIEGRGKMTEEFAEALRHRMPVGRPAGPGTTVTWPEGEAEKVDPDPDDEGMT